MRSGPSPVARIRDPESEWILGLERRSANKRSEGRKDSSGFDCGAWLEVFTMSWGTSRYFKATIEGPGVRRFDG